ncbi:ankyrin repeat, PH and SEC7 domain containing protein secG [Hordeum vulgare]|nr:ankyrin repeat, PH and SEC7 domain containing protein secG [Hordeum vulgare]
MAPPLTSGKLPLGHYGLALATTYPRWPSDPSLHRAGPQRRLLQAAANGDLRLFKSIASELDGGKGRVKEAVEAARYRGHGALHLAARHGRMPVCVHLVEELHVRVNDTDDEGDLFRVK